MATQHTTAEEWIKDCQEQADILRKNIQEATKEEDMIGRQSLIQATAKINEAIMHLNQAAEEIKLAE